MGTIFLTAFLITIILVMVILLIRKLAHQKANPTEDYRNRLALKELSVSYSLNSYNEDTCEWMDKLIINGIKSGIKSYVDETLHTGFVVFNNNTKFKFWNANKYYAWLQEGYFEYYDEESNEDVHIDYTKEQPSPEVMLKFKELLERFNENKGGVEELNATNAKVTRTKREVNV